VHLTSLTLRGFKSFPDRTRLAFAPGVSVVVGPNGSGKSNVTDAVLWAMGEQSPLAVRGASMQDVIFGGGRGRPSGQSAEVELVLDDAEGTLGLGASEVSIVRRLDRSGEGEYRLNGARCRLVDVLEVLSDTGLGKESHSVVSQGRVEAMVTSRPRARRRLIEEAAGLGKHRKRRRRAQLKLARTQDNLDRALDVEREARARLRPLKRQAEAAELHARLERQSLEARWSLARDRVRELRAALEDAEAQVAAARAARAEEERELAAVARRREEAEEALARRSERREALSARAYAARGASERLGYRREAVRATSRRLAAQLVRGRSELEALRAAGASDQAPGERSAAVRSRLEEELASLERNRAMELERELAELNDRHAAAEAEAGRLEHGLTALDGALGRGGEEVENARAARREAERAVESARREAARVGAELAATNQFLRSHAMAPGGASTLADELHVEEGLELALAAAMEGRLGAAVVADRAAAEALLARAGRDGASALVASGRAAPARPSGPPSPGARRLLDLVSGRPEALSLAASLLADAWVIEDLAAVAGDFAGTAVTPAGGAWLGAWGELRQAATGGAERVLAERARREKLILATEAAARAEQAARAGAEAAAEAEARAEGARQEADRELRDARHAAEAAREDAHGIARLIERRREAPDEGAGAVRRAQLRAELAAAARDAERAEREARERELRVERLATRLEHDGALAPLAERLESALEAAAEAIGARLERFEAELAADRSAGEHVAGELRACARQEAEVQGRLRQAGEAVTAVEVRAQQGRDRAAEAERELLALATRLELAAEPGADPLPGEERAALEQRVERLARRREQLGAVNPLAGEEYAEALAHVEDLERQRGDLETALRELAELVGDTDRQIRRTFEETFAAAAANFEDVAAQLFPGGRGRLRLVREDAELRPVLGGGEAPAEREAPAGDGGAAEAEEEGSGGEEDLGVEIEISPAGKATKRLSLLSGGEKSLTALAFLFAVFLARPCPFYILDEVEAALDDENIGRFLTLLRRYASRAQFIVVTHQKRTMEAADALYGVSMGDDGVSKVISRRLPPEEPRAAEVA